MYYKQPNTYKYYFVFVLLNSLLTHLQLSQFQLLNQKTIKLLLLVTIDLFLQMLSVSKASKLHLQILTWEKDYYGLYDYEATKLNKQNFEIQGPCKIFRNWFQGQTTIISNDEIKKGHLPDESNTFLSSIAMQNIGNCQNFVMYPPKRPSQEIIKKDGNADEAGPLNTNAYIIVKEYKLNNRTDGFPLTPGNTIKLGRVQYKVVEIGGLPKKNNDKNKQLFFGQFNGIHDANEIVTGNCKFCFCDQDDHSDFMIFPCKCKENGEGVHVGCLKTWFNCKIKKEINGMVVSYNFTKFQCKICKEPFPRLVTRGQNQKIEMITIDKPQKPYLILEGINERKESKEERYIHVVCPENGNSVRIGRGYQCQIKLQDISVSRIQSQIRYSSNQFYINDTSSKFGSLIKLDHVIQLNNKIKLQIGRSVYAFQLEC